MSITVTTQKELDVAIEAGEERIIIDSPRGVWLRVGGSSRVVAWGSSRVVAWGSSRVVAWGSSSVVARGSSRVEAGGSSSVEAWGSSRVVARDSSSVEAWDSSSVEAGGSSRVVARDSSSVVARDSSSVVARDSSRVEAGGSSSVEASKFTAVHLNSASATVTGGVVIDITALDLTSLTDWAEYHGVEVEGDEAIVYKAVDDDLCSGRGFAYPIGETVVCPDWRAEAACGNGLHLSPSPTQARDYFRGATRFLRCAVPTDELAIIDGEYTDMTPKLKARTVRVICEVDVHGREIK